MYITDTGRRRVHNQSEGAAEFLVLSRMSPFQKCTGTTAMFTDRQKEVSAKYLLRAAR